MEQVHVGGFLEFKSQIIILCLITRSLRILGIQMGQDNHLSLFVISY